MGRGGLRFVYLLQFLSYDVMNDVIMSDADCTPGREPCSIAASNLITVMYQRLLYQKPWKCGFGEGWRKLVSALTLLGDWKVTCMERGKMWTEFFGDQKCKKSRQMTDNGFILVINLQFA